MVKDYKKAQGPLTRTRPDNVIVINASSFTIENTISMKKAMTLALMFVTVILAHAQMGNQRLNPVTFTSQLKTDGSANAEIVFSGKIQAGWHVYSTNIPDGGPTSATFNVGKLDGVELVGKLTPRGKEISTHDPLFDMQLRYFENSVRFVQKVRVSD